MNRSSILSAGEGLKAVAVSNTEVGASVSPGHGEIASIVLPATKPSSTLLGVKVVKSVVRGTILPDVAGMIIPILKAGVPKPRKFRRAPRRARRTNLDLGNMIMLIRMSQDQMTLKCMMSWSG